MLFQFEEIVNLEELIASLHQSGFTEEIMEIVSHNLRSWLSKEKCITWQQMFQLFLSKYPYLEGRTFSYCKYVLKRIVCRSRNNQKMVIFIVNLSGQLCIGSAM